MNLKSEMLSHLLREADSLLSATNHPISNLSNLSSLLYANLPEINWCGFYLLHEGRLLLGPFCGLPACLSIPLGKGVCGTAAQQNRVLSVPDVHLFPGHIACDSASNSEIVLPIHHAGKVIGVLDIDSPQLERFTEEDESFLSALVKSIENHCDFSACFYSLA